MARARSDRAAAVTAPPGAPSWKPLVLVLLAVALALWNATAIWNLWQRAPAVQYQHAVAGLRAAPETARRVQQAAGPAFAQADLLARMSARFAAAERDPTVAESITRNLAAGAAELTRTQLGRVQQALAGLLEPGAADAPPATRWARVRGYLEGLDRADFTHLQAVLRQTISGIYEAYGVEAAVAPGIARAEAGTPYAAFLQVLARRFTALADESAAAGDAAAADVCRRVLRRLLRQWVLDEGPAYSRLIAADLLARELSTADAPDHERVAADLRAFRTAYREAAARRPVALFGIGSEPALALAEHETLVHWTSLTLWLSGASLGAAVMSVFCGWAWVAGGGPPPNRSPGLLGVLTLGLVIAALAVVLMNTAPGWLREDIRRLSAGGAGWPRLPLYALAVTALLLALVPLGLAGARRAANGAAAGWRGSLARIGRLSIASWALLGLLTGAAAGMTELARQRYQRAHAAAVADDYAAVAGDPSGLLSRLRAWQP